MEPGGRRCALLILRRRYDRSGSRQFVQSQLHGMMSTMADSISAVGNIRSFSIRKPLVNMINPPPP